MPRFKPAPQSSRSSLIRAPRPEASRIPGADFPPARKDAVLKAFQGIWSDLFLSPVHLDSALSKLPKNLKSIVAQVVPGILLRPVSQAEALGVGVPEGEPWLLETPKLAHWRSAELMAERMYEAMISRPI